MIQKGSIRLLAAILALVSALSAGCDSSSDSASTNPFVGTWAYELTEDTSIPAGTYSYSFGATDYAFEYLPLGETSALQYEAGTYSWDETTISMTPTKRLGIAVKNPVTTTSSYEIDDSVLTLTDEGYGSTDYHRQ